MCVCNVCVLWPVKTHRNTERGVVRRKRKLVSECAPDVSLNRIDIRLPGLRHGRHAEGWIATLHSFVAEPSVPIFKKLRHGVEDLGLG